MLLRGTNVVVFTILHPDINGETLFRYGDCVIALQPWQGITPPDEFSDTAGLLRVIHLPAHLSLYTPKKSIFIYGVKRSMHSLHLSELRSLGNTNLHTFFAAVPKRTACRKIQWAGNL